MPDGSRSGLCRHANDLAQCQLAYVSMSRANPAAAAHRELELLFSVSHNTFQHLPIALV